ncbi:MAG TPA: methyltransferase domain-containing protein [Polyangiaceae bacterium]|nr:methyltransferase domain-containing protein [Polyangiaceae bacterium]
MSVSRLPLEVIEVPAGSLPSYVDHRTASAIWARFDNGPDLSIERGRERCYPGLAGEAPPTLPLYERAVAELGQATRGQVTRILDAGCGAGGGARLLAQNGYQVVGIDKSDDAIRFARQVAPSAKLIAGDLSFPQVVGTVDAALVIDLLGQVRVTEAVLFTLRALVPAGRPVFISEARAHSAQFLKAPARRAFTRSSLVTLLTISGYELVRFVDVEGSFLTCIATPFAGDGWDSLRQGHIALAAGQHAAALGHFEHARSSTRAAVRLEGALGEAECHVELRNGDGAVAACFRARELAENDARPLALLSRISLLIGDLMKARELAQAAVRLDGADVSAACANAAVADRLTRVYGETSLSFAKNRWLCASNLAPDSFDIALHLADAACAAGDAALAVWALERVRSYGEDNGVAMHVALGSALLVSGRSADALLEARLAQGIAPFDEAVTALVRDIENARA